MTSREDLLNAISLNSSIVNGARVVGPSVAGLMIGAVGVAMCFFLNGLSFIAVIAGLLMMRLPLFERKIEIVSAGEHAWEGIVVFNETSACAHDFAAIPGRRRFRLVVCGADAGVCARCARTRRKRLRHVDVGERIGALVGALVVATYGHLFHTAQTRARRRLVIFAWRCSRFRSRKISTSRSYFFLPPDFGMLLFFSTSNTVLQTIVPDEMRGTRHGRVVTRVRRHDSARQPRSRSRCALAGTPFALGFGAIICAVSALVTLFVIRRREAKNAK